MGLSDDHLNKRLLPCSLVGLDVEPLDRCISTPEHPSSVGRSFLLGGGAQLPLREALQQPFSQFLGIEISVTEGFRLVSHGHQEHIRACAVATAPAIRLKVNIGGDVWVQIQLQKAAAEDNSGQSVRSVEHGGVG
jgi:hypothetical protein